MLLHSRTIVRDLCTHTPDVHIAFFTVCRSTTVRSPPGLVVPYASPCGCAPIAAGEGRGLAAHVVHKDRHLTGDPMMSRRGVPVMLCVLHMSLLNKLTWSGGHRPGLAWVVPAAWSAWQCFKLAGWDAPAAILHAVAPLYFMTGATCCCCLGCNLRQSTWLIIAMPSGHA